MTGYIWSFYLAGEWDQEMMNKLIRQIKLEFTTGNQATGVWICHDTGRTFRFHRSGKKIVTLENGRADD